MWETIIKPKEMVHNFWGFKNQESWPSFNQLLELYLLAEHFYILLKIKSGFIRYCCYSLTHLRNHQHIEKLRILCFYTV